jgi:5'-3' exoribonuclease 1
VFELSKPLKPLQQLLGVLPAASRAFLPPAYRQLMTDVDSPMVHYYPLDFDTDLNGKTKDWEAIVLIPYVP